MIMNRNTTKLFYILLSVFLFSAVVTWTDAVVHPSYFSKISVKIVFFLLLPLSYFFLFREERPSLKRLFSFNAKGPGLSVLLGAALYLLILGAFFVAKTFFDFTQVTESLTAGIGITPSNFLFVALYISFFNSFLEEFFFRGFGFMVLKESLSGPAPYLFSPLCFAFYHSGMTGSEIFTRRGLFIWAPTSLS